MLLLISIKTWCKNQQCNWWSVNSGECDCRVLPDFLRCGGVKRLYCVPKNEAIHPSIHLFVHKTHNEKYKKDDSRTGLTRHV